MALFLGLAELAEELAGEAGRLKKRAAIASAIAAVHAASPDGEDAGLFAMYLAGMPFAEADSRKLNAGGALLTKALLAVSRANGVELTAAYRRHGDLGAAGFDLLAAAAVAAGREERYRAAHDTPPFAKSAKDGAPGFVAMAGSAAGLKPTHGEKAAMYGAPGFVEGSKSAPVGGLSLVEVAEAFAGMAVARTTAVRAGLVEGLLRRASPLEAKYLLKLMLGDMRIGVKESLVEEAIALAASLPVAPTASGSKPDSTFELTSDGSGVGVAVSVAAVRNAVMLEADLGAAVRRAFDGTLGEARMRLFHPLGFMLASPVDTPEEAVERFSGPVVVAPKTGNSKSEMRGSLHSATDDDAVRRSGRDDEFPGMPKKQPGDEVVDTKTATIEAFLEDKYDGMRAQLHCGDAEQLGRVAIYSRNREEVTKSFPELEEAFAKVRPEVDGALGGLIFDGEILGWDLVSGRALPFAVLGQRIGRKRVSNEWRAQVPVVFMAFDLMFAGGELLLDLPLRERRNRLEAVAERLVERVVSPVMVREVAKARKGLEGQMEMFGESEGLHPTLSGETGKDGAPGLLGRGGAVQRLMISPSRLVESAEDIDRAYAEARARANEGVMLKAAESVYQPGRRGLAWVKLKRELATLDVVITGAEFGHGKRAGLLSDYTFAVRGPNYARTGELLNVGKAYSGVTDAEIADLTEFMKAHTLEDQGHFRTVEPLVVLEVAFNNIMRSGRHASGFALRFPRILRIRTDKPASEIDTVERVEEIYQSQVDKPVESGE